MGTGEKHLPVLAKVGDLPEPCPRRPCVTCAESEACDHGLGVRSKYFAAIWGSVRAALYVVHLPEGKDSWEDLILTAANPFGLRYAGLIKEDVGKTAKELGWGVAVPVMRGHVNAILGKEYKDIEYFENVDLPSQRDLHGQLRRVPMEGREVLIMTTPLASAEAIGRNLTASAAAENEGVLQAISHDLQEPLRAIQGMSGLLAKRAEDQLDIKAKGYLTHIVAASERLRRRLEGLRHFSRAGRLVLDDAVDVTAALRESMYDMRERIQEAEAEVRVDGTLPIVKGSKSALTSVFSNLLSNALKYRDEKRPLRVSVSAEELHDYWKISIKDTGAGFDNEYREKIFRFGGRLNAAKAGDGMGLAIVRRIVERHRGRIWASSKPGEGSTFHLTLPKGTESEERMDSPSRRQPLRH